MQNDLSKYTEKICSNRTGLHLTNTKRFHETQKVLDQIYILAKQTRLTNRDMKSMYMCLVHYIFHPRHAFSNLMETYFTSTNQLARTNGLENIDI